jgi:hypothetical protein
MPAVFRSATVDDLPAIIALLMDDPLGKLREDISTPPNPAYLAAFEAIERDPNQLLVVADRPARLSAACSCPSFRASPASACGAARSRASGLLPRSAAAASARR